MTSLYSSFQFKSIQILWNQNECERQRVQENESISVIIFHWLELADHYDTLLNRVKIREWFFNTFCRKYSVIHNNFPSQTFHNGGQQLFPLKSLDLGAGLKCCFGTVYYKQSIFFGLLIPLLSCNPTDILKK